MNEEQSETSSEVEPEEVSPVVVEETSIPEVEESSPEETVETPPKKKATKKAPKKVEPEVKAEATPKKKEAKKTPVKEVPEEKPAKTDAKKAPAKKAAKKAASKESAPRSKKDGLRAGQVRILKALSKKDLMNRVEIAQKAPVDAANCVELIGSHDEDKRAANDVKHYPSLITLGFVKPEQHDVNGKDTILYRITAKGKTEASKH